VLFIERAKTIFMKISPELTHLVIFRNYF